MPQNTTKLDRSQPAQEPEIDTKPSREFPLAGGVTTRKHPTDTTSHQEQPSLHKTTGLEDEKKAFPGAATEVYPESAQKHPDLEDKEPDEAGSMHVRYSSHSQGKFHEDLHKDDTPSKHFTEKPFAAYAQRQHSDYHVPGRFPDPTPTEERSEVLHDKGIDATPGNITFSHAQSQPQESQDKYHYGRDAAIAGGVGAATLGAYKTSSGLSHETAEVKESPIQPDENPYSASGLDPRVGGLKTGSGISPAGAQEAAQKTPLPQQTTSEKRDIAGFGIVPTPEVAQETALPHQFTPERNDLAKTSEHDFSHKQSSPQTQGTTGLGGFGIVDTRKSPEDSALPHQATTERSDLPQKPAQNFSRKQVAPDTKDTAGYGGFGIVDTRKGAEEKSVPHQTRDSNDLVGELKESSRGPNTFVGAGPVPIYDHLDQTPERKEFSPEKHTAEQKQFSPEKHTPEQKELSAENEPEDGHKKHKKGKSIAAIGAGTAAAAAVLTSVFSPKRKSADNSATESKTGTDLKSTTDASMDNKTSGVAAIAGQHHGSSTEQPAKASEPHHGNKIANVVDPRVKDHTNTQPHKSEQGHHDHAHHAATAGGVGAAGYGADKAVKDYSHHPTTQPLTEMEHQRFDPSVKRTGDLSQPAQQHGHHYGRDAAIAGGVGAAGYGAYQASRPEDTSYNTPKVPEHQSATQTSLPQPTQPAQQVQPSQTGQHHHGRDGAVGAGVGAAGYGAYKSLHDKQDTLHTSQNPYQSHIPVRQPAQQTPQHPVQQPLSQPQVQQQPIQSQPLPTQQSQHHYGRDAAVTGGAGLAGYGASKAYSQSGQDRSDHGARNIHSTSDNQRLAQQSAQQAYQQPSQPHQNQQAQQPQHHYGRDATLAGAGGVAGYGAYKAMQPGHNDTYNAGQPTQYSQPMQQTTQQPSQLTGQQHAQPTAQPPNQQTASHQRYDSVQQPTDDHHHKRDAAVLGGAGVAGAGAAYAYNQHEAEQTEKERLKELEAQRKQQEKELAKQQKEEQKALEKQQKEQQKELKHEKKVAEKEAKKEEKHQQKEAEKEAKRQQKEAEKAAAAQAKHEQKEAEREQKYAAQVAAAEEKHKQEMEEKERKHAAMVAAAEEKQRAEEEQQRAALLQQQHQPQQQQSPDQLRTSDQLEREDTEKEGKKHHILPFLHRDKSKRKSVDEKKSSSPRHSKEYSPVEEAGSPRKSSDSGNGHRHRSKLHKDPPRGHPAREAIEQQTLPYEHVGADGPIDHARKGQ